MRIAGTELVIIDEVHFLDLSTKEGKVVNDHLKYLANHTAATFVYTGNELEASGLFLEGGAKTRATQTAGRNDLHKVAPFQIGTVNKTLVLRLGVPIWVAPLVAPAVDLPILGLLLGIRQLALARATTAHLRPARRLLIFASAVTLALNVADPLVAGEYGKAAFDAVGPLLLIGWAEVGPDLLGALTIARRPNEGTPNDVKRDGDPVRRRTDHCRADGARAVQE